MTDKPSVLMFGGLNTWSRSVAAFLVPEEGEALVSSLRIVDKFSVHPPTTYLGSHFPKILENPLVEYKQANLTVPATVSKMFDPPEGQAPYSYIFDFTGEVRHDRPDMVQIQQTMNVARLLGGEAARREVKAYVRVTHSYYETPEKGSHDEKESIKPVGVRGIWWHEATRVLASIEKLNLAILRIGLCYGPYIDYGVLCSTLTVAAVYGYMKKPMKGLWSPGKNSMNTVHVDDVAAAVWALAGWMSGVGRIEANTIAGEGIQTNEKSKVKDVEGVPDHNLKIVAPLFNLVDDTHSTLLSIGTAVTGLFGTTFGFHDFFTTTMVKLTKLNEGNIEDINEDHVSAWTEMITASNPPVVKTPLSAYMDESILQKMTIALSADKIKNVVGFQLKRPKFEQAHLKEMVDKWKEEGSWPTPPEKS